MIDKNHFRKWLILSLILMISLWDASLVCPAGAGAKDFGASKLVDRYAIGCVLPLSGRNAVVGNRVLDAIVLASGLFD
ncbi:MAG: hypothetical protein ACXWMO_02800, partial [Syntrophales bacterium]